MAHWKLSTAGTIVLIDDDTDFIEIVSETLNLLGYHSLTFQNPRHALEIIRQEKINLVITDFHMKEMTALDVIQAVKSHDINIPVIVVTGDLSLGNEKASMQMGADAYFYKPLEFNELIRLVVGISYKPQSL